MRKGLVLGLFVALVCGVGFLLHARQPSAAAEPAAQRAVSVVTTPVVARDVPIYLDGLGNVSAYKTVVVRPQVQGLLERVLFREGQAVHRGDLLAEIDPRPFQIALAQAKAARARDSAQLREAQLNYKRYISLAKQKLVAPQQVDDQAAVAAQDQGTVEADDAAIANAKLQLDWAQIRAPIDGTTGVRLVDPGNLVRLTDTTGLVVLTELDPIAVLFTLPEDELPEVARQLKAGKVTALAYSRDGQTRLGTGTVALIDNQINESTATMRLKALFANPNHLLWPNQLVKVRLLLRTDKGALCIPTAAVGQGPHGAFVYVVGSDRKAAMRTVTTTAQDGDFSLVARGLAAGDEVVIEGQSQLKPGSRVAARPSRPEDSASATAGVPSGQP